MADFTRPILYQCGCVAAEMDQPSAVLTALEDEVRAFFAGRICPACQAEDQMAEEG